ncbi:hypothetical protein NON20_25760 (plasmid) [Synechocystis sp. B12]|nr:hypothetical protein NON20_25760 [Synechocystis sp. B12]
MVKILFFSPFSILHPTFQTRSQKDLEILDKIYSNSILLGDDSPQGWGIQYAREFDMTNDSKLFPPRPKWEAQGYIADEYGHWLKGNWQEIGELGVESGEWAVDVLSRPQGVILSRDKTQFIRVEEVEDIALPLYEGRMIGQFDFSEKGWVSGKGRSAEWRDIDFQNKIIDPQFLMSYKDFLDKGSFKGLRTGFLAIGSSTNARSMISSVINSIPCGNSVPIFQTNIKILGQLGLVFMLNNLIYDFSLRARLGGININYFVVEETPLLKPEHINKYKEILKFVARLNLIGISFAREWLEVSSNNGENLKSKNLYQNWAITQYERLRLRIIIDASIAHIYNLEISDFSWILRNCDQPKQIMQDKAFYRTLDPKGFWRVDKEKDPELRHTVLSLVAFHELKKIGLEAFLNLNDGEGWMLPDTLRLADYGLGHGDRAQAPQPVTARFALEDWDNQPVPANAPISYRQRFYPWQLAKTPEQSWAECQLHAENLRLLLKQDQPPEPTPTKSEKLPSDPDYQPPTDLFGNPLQVDLFGNVIT